MPGAGEVVALTECPVYLPKLALIAEALIAAALPPATADLLPLGLPAHGLVHAVLALLALALGSQVPRITAADATLVGADAAALGAVVLCLCGASAGTLVVDSDLQSILKADGFDSELVPGVLSRAASGVHRYIERDLTENKELF